MKRKLKIIFFYDAQLSCLTVACILNPHNKIMISPTEVFSSFFRNAVRRKILYAVRYFMLVQHCFIASRIHVDISIFISSSMHARLLLPIEARRELCE